MLDWLFKKKEPKVAPIFRTTTFFRLTKVGGEIEELKIVKGFRSALGIFPRTHRFENGCLCYWAKDGYMRRPLSNFEKVELLEERFEEIT